MKAREAIDKTQYENRIMQAIEDAERFDLLFVYAVIIPARDEFDCVAIWFDDSYNTMIQDNGEFIKPDSGGWLMHAKDCVNLAGFKWHCDCEPPTPASAYIPEPAAGYGWRSKKPDPTPPAVEHRCKKCRWIHEANSTAGTSFMGVGLCPLHAAAPELLQALGKMAVNYPDGPCFCHVHGEGQAQNGHLTAPHQHNALCDEARAAIAKAEGRA